MRIAPDKPVLWPAVASSFACGGIQTALTPAQVKIDPKDLATPLPASRQMFFSLATPKPKSLDPRS